MKTSIILLATIALISCTETKKTSASAEATKEKQETTVDMEREGYVAGVIHKSDADSGCAYTIETKKYNYLLDPTNIDEAFMKDELNVWFKHRGLRMQNRCPDATPIEITEMKVRS